MTGGRVLVSLSGRTRVGLAAGLVAGAVVLAAGGSSLLPGAPAVAAAAPAPAAEVAVPGVGQAGEGSVVLDAAGLAQGVVGTSFSSDIVRRVDEGSGQLTGRVVFEPIVFRHPLGPASPLFADALVTARVLPSVQLSYLGARGDRRYTIRLRQVVISRISQRLPDTQARGSLATRVPAYEDVSLTFREIEWTAGAEGGRPAVRRSAGVGTG